MFCLGSIYHSIAIHCNSASSKELLEALKATGSGRRGDFTGVNPSLSVSTHSKNMENVCSSFSLWKEIVFLLWQDVV